jgi:hypothetical protein
MKLVHYIIAASLILNVAIFIYAKPFASRTPVASSKQQVRKPDAQPAPAFNIKTIPPEQLMQKLTDMGFPPDLIRDIVETSLRQNKMPTRYIHDDPRYWRAYNYMFSATRYAEELAAQREINETIEKLFGADYKDPPNTEELRRRYGDMSDEKLRALKEINDKYHKQADAWREGVSKKGETTKENMNFWATMPRQEYEEISKILTPDELAEYNVRTSTASGILRRETNFFDVTEQEFRDMSAVYQKTFSSSNPNASSEFATQKERDGFVAAQYRQILGEERYADYLQAKNEAHEKLNLIVHRLDLPLSAARAVVSVQDDIRARAVAIDTDASLTNAERAARYDALAQEAQERITQTLGERGYNAYRENSQNWIQTLESGKPPPREIKN